MKKLYTLTLMMLVSTSTIIVQASTSQQTIREKIASRLSEEQKAKISTAASSFKSMSQEEKRAALSKRFQNRATNNSLAATRQGNIQTKVAGMQSTTGMQSTNENPEEANLASYSSPIQTPNYESNYSVGDTTENTNDNDYESDNYDYNY